MSSLPENLRFTPAVTSLVVSLQMALGSLNEALGTLKSAVDYANKQKAEKQTVKLLLERAATLLMDNGEVKEALQYLEKLHR